MDAEGNGIMTALRMVTYMAQQYLAKHGGIHQGVNNPHMDNDEEIRDNKRRYWEDGIQSGANGKKIPRIRTRDSPAHIQHFNQAKQTKKEKFPSKPPKESTNHSDSRNYCFRCPDRSEERRVGKEC